MSDPETARAWIEQLPAPMAAQRRLLGALLDAVGRDPRRRLLLLDCSVARARGDAWSDLDTLVAVDDAAFEQVVRELPAWTAALGVVVDALHHAWPPSGDAVGRRSFVQYADGAQLDMVTFPVSRVRVRSADTRALHDPDGLMPGLTESRLRRASADDRREWAFLGWAALGDGVKYVARGSGWEALERLHEARTQAWRLWAAASGADFPVFGVTAALDLPDAAAPPWLRPTLAASAHVSTVHSALVACAEALRRASEAAGVAEPALAAWVRARLADVAPALPAVGELANVVIDCADPDAVVGFWCGVLGVQESGRAEPYVVLTPVPGSGLRILLQRVPEPKRGKNRVHLDVHADDLDAATRRAVELGGTVLAERRQFGTRWRVVQDPEGNELCIAVEEGG